MKRYSKDILSFDPSTAMKEDPQGDWCRYEDVRDFIEEAYHEYDPRPDGKRCKVCKQKEGHAMHHWQPEPPEKDDG